MAQSLQSSNSDFLERTVDEVPAGPPYKVAEYRKGKKDLIGFFHGQVMRCTQGKAEPKATNELVGRKLAGLFFRVETISRTANFARKKKSKKWEGHARPPSTESHPTKK